MQTLVAGEATLNDPIAIVLFTILNSRDFDPTKVSIAASAAEIVILLVASIAVGLILGVVFTFFQKACIPKAIQLL